MDSKQNREIVELTIDGKFGQNFDVFMSESTKKFVHFYTKSCSPF